MPKTNDTQPKPLHAYVRVSRVGGREGESFIAPDVQRKKIEAFARSRRRSSRCCRRCYLRGFKPKREKSAARLSNLNLNVFRIPEDSILIATSYSPRSSFQSLRRPPSAYDSAPQANAWPSAKRMATATSSHRPGARSIVRLCGTSAGSYTTRAGIDCPDFAATSATPRSVIGSIRFGSGWLLQRAGISGKTQSLPFRISTVAVLESALSRTRTLRMIGGSGLFRIQTWANVQAVGVLPTQ